MARKHASIKGMGADNYLQDRRPAKNKKATFYLPADLVDRLDDAWLDMRRVNRALTKSELVTAALNAALTDYTTRREESALHRAVVGEPPSQEG